MNIINKNIQLSIELIKLLNFFEIKERKFKVIIDNASNNSTLKNKFKNYKLTRLSTKKESFIAYLTYVINSMIETFLRLLIFKLSTITLFYF